MENKEAFVLYKSFYEPIKELSLEEKGQLLDAIFTYQINPNNPVGSMGSKVKMAFEFFKNQFRLDDIKYQSIVNRNRTNGLKGGRPKNPLGSEKPKKADKGNEKVKDITSSANELATSVDENVISEVWPEGVENE